MMEPTQIDWARLAAFIDGEGTIVIKPYLVKYTQLFVRIANTDPRLPLWCRKCFDHGKVYASDSQSRKFPGRMRVYTWIVQSKKAELILRGCLPYFILKKEQAEIALAYRETFNHIKGNTPLQELTPARYALREHYRQELSRIKKELPQHAFVGAPEPPNPKETIQ
jgi:hypothetical protein